METELRKALYALANDIEWCIYPEELSALYINRYKEEVAIDEAIEKIKNIFISKTPKTKRIRVKIMEPVPNPSRQYSLGGKNNVSMVFKLDTTNNQWYEQTFQRFQGE